MKRRCDGMRMLGWLSGIAVSLAGVAFASRCVPLGCSAATKVDGRSVREDHEELKSDLLRAQALAEAGASAALESSGVLLSRVLHGRVLEIALQAATFTIELDSGEVRALQVAEAAATDLAELRVGDHIEATTVTDRGSDRVLRLSRVPRR